MFRLTFQTSNAAFCEDDGERTGAARAAEIARILRQIANNVSDEMRPGDGGPCLDANGNTVGHWSLSKKA